jgi:hypothetical protein
VVDEARVKRKIPELLINENVRDNPKQYFLLREKAMTLERNNPNVFRGSLHKIVKSLDDLERKLDSVDFEFHDLKKKKK